MAGEGAGINVVRLAARTSPLVIATAVEGPVTGELPTRWLAAEAAGQVVPTPAAVLAYEPGCTTVCNSLKAEYRNKPIEQYPGVVPPHGAQNPGTLQCSTRIGHE